MRRCTLLHRFAALALAVVLGMAMLGGFTARAAAPNPPATLTAPGDALMNELAQRFYNTPFQLFIPLMQALENGTITVDFGLGQATLTADALNQVYALAFEASVPLFGAITLDVYGVLTITPQRVIFVSNLLDAPIDTPWALLMTELTPLLDQFYVSQRDRRELNDFINELYNALNPIEWDDEVFAPYQAFAWDFLRTLAFNRVETAAATRYTLALDSSRAAEGLLGLADLLLHDPALPAAIQAAGARPPVSVLPQDIYLNYWRHGQGSIAFSFDYAIDDFRREANRFQRITQTPDEEWIASASVYVTGERISRLSLDFTTTQLRSFINWQISEREYDELMTEIFGLAMDFGTSVYDEWTFIATDYHSRFGDRSFSLPWLFYQAGDVWFNRINIPDGSATVSFFTERNEATGAFALGMGFFDDRFAPDIYALRGYLITEGNTYTLTLDGFNFVITITPA